MPANISVHTEEDPAFIVKVFAARITRSLNNSKKVKLLKSLKGKFALQFKDGQKLTASLTGGRGETKEIYLECGVGKDSKIVIHLDANDLDARPKIDGGYRHPFFTLKVGKLLDDSDICWMEAAKDFHDYARSDEKFPRAIKMRATDEGEYPVREHLILGEGEPEMEIEGSSRHLAALFSGSSILLQEVLKGKIKVYATLERQVEFTRVNMKYMLGL